VVKRDKANKENVKMTKKIVAQNTEVVIGADVHTRSHVVTAKVGKEIVDQRRIGTDRGAWEHYLDRFPGCNIAAVYESGPHGYNLFDMLKAMSGENGQTISPCVAPAANVPKAAGKKRKKTDRRDSVDLVHAYDSGSFEPVVVPDAACRAERELLRTKETLAGDATMYKNRIHGRLKNHGIEYPEEKLFSPEGQREALKRARALYDPTGEIHVTLRLLFKMLRHVEDALASIKKRIRNLFKNGSRSELAKKLEKNIPGIGVESAMVIVTEVADFFAFRNSDAFASYTGLVAGAHNSGDSERSGAITREGNRRLRRILVECAWTHIRYDEEAAKKYARLKYRRGARRAIVAIARWLAVKIYHIVVHGGYRGPASPVIACSGK